MKYKLALLVLVLITGMQCQKGEQIVTIETSHGKMKVKLYDSTPKHRDNFVKLVKEGYYDDLLFHRVIKGFMIQGGDPDSKGAPADAQLGSGSPGYQLDAEFGALHFKGTLSAARMPDQANPQKKSSGSQFFIVQGYQVGDEELARWEQQKNITYSEEDKERYRTLGGYPFLDGDYTVFGEVIEGLEIIDQIAEEPIGQADRPQTDIPMKISMN